MQPLCSGGLESTYSLYPSLAKLLSLLELDEASQVEGGLDFIEDWTARLTHLDCDFQFIEPVLALRHSALHCLLERTVQHGTGTGGTRIQAEQLFTVIRDNLLTQAQLAREASKYQVCVF